MTVALATAFLAAGIVLTLTGHPVAAVIVFGVSFVFGVAAFVAALRRT